MIFHAVGKQLITLSDMAAFRTVLKLVQDMPDDEGMSCHVVARLVAPYVTGFRVVDGHFGFYSHTHSWLRRGTTIIDPYPWASANPIILTVAALSPWRHLYKESALPEEAARADRYIAGLRSGKES